MRAPRHEVEWNSCGLDAPAAVAQHFDGPKRAVKASAPTLLAFAERVAKTVGARRDLRAQLKRMEPVVIARDAHCGHFELPERPCDT